MKYLKTYEHLFGITFRKWLEKNPLDVNITVINLNDKKLNDLDGIQEFKNLKELYCSYNKLTSLNLEGLDKLETLYCNNNHLKDLNLNGLNNLQELNCHTNKLKHLNLEGMDKLQEISCHHNNLTSLNLEGLDKLEDLYCQNNNLPYKDLEGYWEWYQKEYPDRWEAKKFNF